MAQRRIFCWRSSTGATGTVKKIQHRNIKTWSFFLQFYLRVQEQQLMADDH